MAQTPPTFLQEIEAFLAEQNMAASYFGKASVGNSELVSRLRNNRRVWPETEAKARSFMLLRRTLVRNGGYVNAAAADQVQKSHKGAA